MNRLAYLALPALLSAAPAFAQAVRLPPDAATEQDAAGTALVAAFSLFCLDHFPEPAQIEAVPGQVTPLPQSAVREFLHDDPGRGWSYKADGGEYIVSVEDPPYHTCAVRRFYASPPHYRRPWLVTTGTWAAAGHGTFEPDEMMPARKQGNLTIEGRARALVGGPARETFIEIGTRYANGRFEQRLARTYGR